MSFLPLSVVLPLHTMKNGVSIINKVQEKQHQILQHYECSGVFFKTMLCEPSDGGESVPGGSWWLEEAADMFF